MAPKAKDHHHCECKHTRIKYCAKCCVPHCLDCGQEWVVRQYGYWYQPSYGNGYYLTGNGSGTASGMTTGTVTVTSGTDYIGTEPCKH
jgi:hypothetical protein